MKKDKAQPVDAEQHPGVGSLGEFLAWIEKQQEMVKELNKNLPLGNRIVLYFRGVSKSHYKLLPAIYRDGLIENEDVIFNECLARNPQDFVGELSTFDKLVKMQHYGVPTRLLDVTSNPLVALYFACQDPKTTSGRVYAFYVSEKAIKYSDSNTVSVVANLARRPYEEINILDASRGDVTTFNKRRDIQALLSAIRGEKPSFLSAISKGTLESVWAVKPKMNNNRLVRQEGAFLLFGILGCKQVPLSLPDIEWARKCIVDMKAMRSLYEDEVPGDIQKLYKRINEIRKNYLQAPKEIPCPRRVEIDSDTTMKEIFKEFCSELEAVYDKAVQILANFAEDMGVIFLLREELEPRMDLEKLPIEGDYCGKILELSDKVARAQYPLQVLSGEGLIFCAHTNIQNQAKVAEKIKVVGMTRDKLFPELDVLGAVVKKVYARTNVTRSVPFVSEEHNHEGNDRKGF